MLLFDACQGQAWHCKNTKQAHGEWTAVVKCLECTSGEHYHLACRRRLTGCSTSHQSAATFPRMLTTGGLVAVNGCFPRPELGICPAFQLAAQEVAQKLFFLKS
jgi:hypothetical protein